MLSAENISLDIGGVLILHGLNFRLQAGEITVIVGPNGAGKTSLLRVLTGDIQPTHGDVSFNHKPIHQWPMLERARHMAILPQSSNLNFPFLVEEVVMLGRTPHSSGLERDHEIVQQTLELVDASYLRGRAYTYLSGGEKQRVQLARVIAQIWDAESDTTQALILDEPTSSLDLEHQRMVLQAVRQLAARNILVIMVLHDLNLAANCADQIIMLRCGRVAASGSPLEVIEPDIIKQIFNVEVDIIPSRQTNLPVIIPR